MSPSDGVGRGLADAEIPNLAGFDQLAECAPGLFDRHRRVDPVLVVEVDVIDAEPGQTGVARRSQVVRFPVDGPGAVVVALVAELGGQHHLVPAAGDGLADQFLVDEGAIDIGGVEEGDPGVEGGDEWSPSTRRRRPGRRTGSCPCSPIPPPRPPAPRHPGQSALLQRLLLQRLLLQRLLLEGHTVRSCVTPCPPSRLVLCGLVTGRVAIRGSPSWSRGRAAVPPGRSASRCRTA